MSSFIVALIIFLIVCGHDSAKEKARIAKLKENKTNLPLQISIKRKIFNQMLSEYEEELRKAGKEEKYEWEVLRNKEILDALAIRHNIPTRKELKIMNGETCGNLMDLANLYSECQVAKMGHTALTYRCAGFTCRTTPYSEDELNNIPQDKYKNSYERAVDSMKERDAIDKKYPGLFSSKYVDRKRK